MPEKIRIEFLVLPQLDWIGGERSLDLVTGVVAGVPGSPPAGLARSGGGRRGAREAPLDAGARVRRRGAGTPERARRGRGRARVPPAGGRLRGVVPRVLGDRDPR